MLLYAQPLTRILTLTLDGVLRDDGGVTIRLGEPPAPVPEPFASLLLRHARRRLNLTTAPARWLFPGRRDDDFGRFICHGPGTAAIDWEAAIDALHAGGLPCSAGERRMLCLAASLADRAPVSLGEAVADIDDRSVDLLLTAIRHAAGRRQFPR
jgi:hypothetical protein